MTTWKDRQNLIKKIAPESDRFEYKFTDEKSKDGKRIVRRWLRAKGSSEEWKPSYFAFVYADLKHFYQGGQGKWRVTKEEDPNYYI